MWVARSSIFPQCFPRKWKHIALLFASLLLFILIFRWKSSLENQNFCSCPRCNSSIYLNITQLYFSRNIQHDRETTRSLRNGHSSLQINYSYNEIKDGYLVWSSACHIPSEDFMHPSIIKFVKKIEYETCSTLPLLSSIVSDTNDTFALVVNDTIAKNYANFTCCWAPIYRPTTMDPQIDDYDLKFDERNCTDFERKISLPSDLNNVMISCRADEYTNNTKPKVLYKNVHAILNPARNLNIHKIPQSSNEEKSIRNNRKMSILILGIDSVSRLNFLRSLPETEKYLRETGWLSLKGYNKMGLNTFPNLMAVLTGQNETSVESTCKPNQAYGLDNCPFLWHGYKKAGYVTAYGEDYGPWSTFNYEKSGFVYPPTDYYLRTYIIATEKLLEPRYKFVNMYCTGPELAVGRILDYASKFAKKFLTIPYFGFFWANSISHNDLNAISSMDTYFLNYFQDLKRNGVINDTIIIFLSDHGMRFGEFRETYIGWYEERLPFVYFHIPHQEYPENAEILHALKINENRLTSPYDLYETLRDILMRSEITVSSSSACPKCQTLFRPVPKERSCTDAGISPHWCTCGTTQLISDADKNTIAMGGLKTFLNYVENITEQYKNEEGHRLCAKLQLEKIHYVNQLMETTDDINANDKKYSFRIEVTPGGGMFEFLIYTHNNTDFKLRPEEISRINSYANDSKCLENEFKKFCSCLYN